MIPTIALVLAMTVGADTDPLIRCSDGTYHRLSEWGGDAFEYAPAVKPAPVDPFQPPAKKVQQCRCSGRGDCSCFPPDECGCSKCDPPDPLPWHHAAAKADPIDNMRVQCDSGTWHKVGEWKGTPYYETARRKAMRNNPPAPMSFQRELTTPRMRFVSAGAGGPFQSCGRGG